MSDEQEPQSEGKTLELLRAARQRELSLNQRQSYLRDETKRDAIRKALLSDFDRVWNHPDNPYAGKAVSRQRYRELGHYSEVVVSDIFGTHDEFERAAGKRDLRHTTAARNTTARLHTERAISEYAAENVVPHFGKWDSKVREVGSEGLLAICSDIHSNFRDPFAWRVWLDVLRDTKPDAVVLNGDVADFPKVGRYTQIPGATSLSLQSEIDCVREEIIRSVREIVGDGVPFYWIIGNHEQRLIRYLADSAPELADLECLKYDKLFGVDEYDVEMVFGGNFLAPTQKDRTQNIRRTHKIFWDCYMVTHGTSTTKFSAAAELQRYGMSGTSGHTHLPQVYYKPNFSNRMLNWTSTGMMCSHAIGQHYVPGGVPAWVMGFALVTVDIKRKQAFPQPVIIHLDVASAYGRTWTATPEEESHRLTMYD